MIDLQAGDDTGLIETPESGVRTRAEADPLLAEAAPREDRPARRARGPRKPKGEGKAGGEVPGGGGTGGEPPQEAAE